MKMDFPAQVKSFANRIENLIPNISTEEATKNALVMPLFQMLGYDVFNPEEFVPEFTADVGIKKGERVDYAVKIDNSPVLIVEVKPVSEKLEKHDSQLFRYFSVSHSKFAILTNGVNYKFYTDLDEHNKMDLKPFLDIDLLELKDSQINELYKFHKSKFDVSHIFNSAEELKYSTEIKQLFLNQFENPSECFVNYVVGEIYPGRKTQNVLDKFSPIVKKAYAQFINELVSDKIKNALEGTDKENAPSDPEPPEVPPAIHKIVTTEEELEGFFIIKQMLKDSFDYSRITYKDTESYFNVLIDNNVRKWICRLYINSKGKSIAFNNPLYGKEKFEINSMLDLYQHEDKLLHTISSILIE